MIKEKLTEEEAEKLLHRLIQAGNNTCKQHICPNSLEKFNDTEEHIICEKLFGDVIGVIPAMHCPCKMFTPEFIYERVLRKVAEYYGMWSYDLEHWIFRINRKRRSEYDEA